MTAELRIRAATLADLDRLLDLCKLLAVGVEPDQPPAHGRERFVALTANPAHRIFVAVQGDRIVGTYALILVGGLAHGGRRQGIVEDVVVDESARRGGIGRAMMQHAMRICADEHCYKLVLSSHLQREAAHRFYEGLGFRKHGYSFLISP